MVLNLITQPTSSAREAAKIDVSRRRVTSVLERVHAEEVMRRDIIMVENEDPVAKLVELASMYQYHGYPVVEDGNLIGIVTIKNLLDAMTQNKTDSRFGDIARKDPVVVFLKRPFRGPEEDA